MFETRIVRSTLLFALTTGLYACPDSGEPPIEPPPLQTIETASALSAANANLRRSAVGLAHSGAFLESSDFFGGLLADPAICEAEECPPNPSLEDRADELATMVAEQILVATNVETAEPTKIVLSMKAEVVCLRADLDDPSVTKIDEDCAARLAADPIRIELTSRRAGDIDAALLVGRQALRPLELALYERRVAATIDLGVAVESAKIIASIGGEDLEEFAGELSGRVRIEVTENGSLDHTVAASILSAVRIAMTFGEDTLRYSVGTASPLLSLRIDGNDKTLVAESNSGPVDASIPLAIFESSELVCSTGPDGMTTCEEPEKTLTGVVDVHIPGSHGRATLDASDTVTVTGFGIDDAMTVRYDGVQILGIDLNAQSGRNMDFELSGSEEGFVLAVQPLFDLVLDLNLDSLRDQIEVPAELASDTLRVRLDGDTKPAIRLTGASERAPAPGDAPSAPASVLEVLRGRFTVSSRAANAEVRVDAGQCLVAEEGDEGAHPVELLFATSCN